LHYCRHSITLVAVRYVLIMITSCFTLLPLVLGIACVLIMGGPGIAAAGFVIAIPVSLVRKGALAIKPYPQ
jgi:hypothetical protein